MHNTWNVCIACIMCTLSSAQQRNLLLKFASKFTSKFLKKHRRCFVRNIEDVSTESANVILRIMFSEDEVWSELNPKDGFRKGVVSQHPKTEGSESLNLLVENVTSLSELFFTFFSESLRRVVRNNWKMLIKLIETAALWFAHFARPILSQNHVLDLDGKDAQFQTRVLDIKIWRRKSVTFLTSNLMSSETMFRSLEIWPRKSITFLMVHFENLRNIDSDVQTMRFDLGTSIPRSKPWFWRKHVVWPRKPRFGAVLSSKPLQTQLFAKKVRFP